MKKYTICLDIGFRNTGVVVYCSDLKKIVYTDCIRILPLERNSKAQQHFDECQELANHLRGLINLYPPSKTIIEAPHGGAKNASGIKSMASSMAVLASVCTYMGIDATLVTPLQLKRLVAVKGSVTKPQMINYVEAKLECIGFKYPNKHKWCKEHVADAGAVLLVAERMGLLTLELNQ